MPDRKSENNSAPVARRQYRRTAERRQEILVAVVQLLSEPDCAGVTTKEIAAFMGVADGALYRHFSGKTEILGELIGFSRTAFESMFDEINAEGGVTMLERSQVKARALLLFAEANRGLARLLTGEILTGEAPQVREALRETLAQAESAIAKSLELAVVEREIGRGTDAKARAALVMSYVQGRWARFVSSGFAETPTENWENAQAVLFSRL